MTKTTPDVGASRRRGWVVDAVVGGLVGGVLGAIVAVNVVIYSGVEGGYEAALGDVFAHSVALGILVVAILLAGPVAGVVFARRRRHRSG